MTRWPEMPADVAPVPGRMKGEMMDKGKIEALVDGPERLDMLAFHLRNMADGQVDGIDADRLSRAASLIVALTALVAAVARAEKAEDAVRKTQRFWTVTMPKMNIGDSFLDAEDFGIWNEAEIATSVAFAALPEAKGEK